MTLDSKKSKKMEQLFNSGKTKTGLGFLASVNADFSSKKLKKKICIPLG